MEKMTIIQAALCGVVYWLAVGNLPFVGLWSLQTAGLRYDYRFDSGPSVLGEP